MTGLIWYYLGTMSLSTLCNSCSLKHSVKFIVTLVTPLNKRSKLAYWYVLRIQHSIVTLITWINLLDPTVTSLQPIELKPNQTSGKNSVPDSWHFVREPDLDPCIRTLDYRSGSGSGSNNKLVFFEIFAYYLLYVHLHQSSKIFKFFCLLLTVCTFTPVTKSHKIILIKV